MRGKVSDQSNKTNSQGKAEQAQIAGLLPALRTPVCIRYRSQGHFFLLNPSQPENALSILLEHQCTQPALGLALSCVLLFPLRGDFTTDLASQACLEAVGSATRGKGHDLTKAEAMRPNLLLYDLNYNTNTGQ